MSPESNILLVRAKDSMMVIIMIIILFTGTLLSLGNGLSAVQITMPLNPEKKKNPHILGSTITFIFKIKKVSLRENN